MRVWEGQQEALGTILSFPPSLALYALPGTTMVT